MDRYRLKETAPFVQFSSVKITENFNTLFDIERTPKQTLEHYCQQLITKAFHVSHSNISEFISHHCTLVKDPIQWLNKFEKLLSLNEELFSSNKNQSRLMKFHTCIEFKRTHLLKEKAKKTKTKPPKQYINAESEDRFFSFKVTKERVQKMSDIKEKIYFLTEEIYDYRTEDIIMKNQKLPEFDDECEKMIGRIQTLSKLREDMEESKIRLNEINGQPEKVVLHGPLNIVTNAFKQMMTSVKPNGKPYIQLRIKDMADFIHHNFVDQDGNPLSKATLQTYLSPGRNDKDPNSDMQINF